MAMLQNQDTGARVALAAHMLVGRSSACTLRIDEPTASGEHARIEHRDGVWTVRDLGSRNGTFVNGARVERGPCVLAVGDEIVFGGPKATWLLSDLSPPVALARRVSDGELFAAVDGLLALPSADEPRVCVALAEDGRWTVEADGAGRLATDGEVLSIAGRAFVLHLPTPLPVTVPEHGAPPARQALQVDLRVSRDEETVEVALRTGEGVHVLSPRAHHYTLLTLARKRLKDSGSPDLAEPQRGWLSVDDLCRMLGMDEMTLNVAVYRIRRDVAAQGIANAAQLIERRRGSRQLRLGTEQVSVGKL